jgi:hypothetical protein
MDEKLKILAVEAMPFVQLEKLKTERLTIEAVPEPEKKTLFQQKIADFKESLQGELKQGITNIVAQSARNIQDNLSIDLLFEQAKQVYRKEVIKLSTPYLMLAYVDQLREALEYEARSWDVSNWHNRFQGIDNQIQTWKVKIPKPFDASMINVETMGSLIHGSKQLRFPADRIGMADGKYYDKWLTDLLKSKPVFFEPQERYQESLKEFYTKVYLVESEKENKAATQENIEQEKAIEQAKQQPEPQGQIDSIPADELEEMREHQQGMDYGMRRLREMGRV